jgi:hypothetical protein
LRTQIRLRFRYLSLIPSALIPYVLIPSAQLETWYIKKLLDSYLPRYGDGPHNQVVFLFWGKHITITLVKFPLKNLEKEYAKMEDDIRAVHRQSVGQIVGEVMKQLDTNHCE